MADIKTVVFANLLSDLQARQGELGEIVFLTGKNSIGDGLGGFYLWDDTSTATQDLTYMNVITVTGIATGRWLRVFQKAKQYAQGIMVNSGGVKSMYISGTTNSSGQTVTYLTDNNTSSGNALFTEVWQIIPQQDPKTASGSSPLVGYGVVSSDLKTLTCYFSQSSTTTLASTILGIAGTVIKGLAPVPSGVPVQVSISGI